jgi:hypothetical protein
MNIIMESLRKRQFVATITSKRVVGCGDGESECELRHQQAKQSVFQCAEANSTPRFSLHYEILAHDTIPYSIIKQRHLSRPLPDYCLYNKQQTIIRMIMLQHRPTRSFLTASFTWIVLLLAATMIETVYSFSAPRIRTTMKTTAHTPSSSPLPFVPIPPAPVVPRIIQGGMGIRISSWQLARAVSRKGELGVVSGTGMDTILVRTLQNGMYVMYVFTTTTTVM